jgi:hypothetical protein
MEAHVKTPSRTGSAALAGLSLAGLIALAAVLRRRWSFPVRMIEREVPVVEPPPAATDTSPDSQPPGEGQGDYHHRIYRVRIADPLFTPDQVMERVKRDPNRYVPHELASFEKIEGAEGMMATGDVYRVHLRNPYNTRVRVAEVTPGSFLFTALEGHVEAGVIRFACEPDKQDASSVVFSIESWARHHDRFIELTYETLKLGKKIQQTIWLYFCERVVEESGGHRVGDIEVIDERTPADQADAQNERLVETADE